MLRYIHRVDNNLKGYYKKYYLFQEVEIMLPVGTPVETQAGAPSAPSVDAQAKTKNNELKNIGEQARGTMTDAEKAMEGSKSAAIQMVRAIGNANKKVTRTGPNKESIVSNEVIGYVIKNVSGEAIAIPVAPYKGSNICEANISGETRQLPAGAQTVVNLVEAGMLVSQVEFAGKFTGNGVEARFTPKPQKDSQLPKVTFKTSGGSIKDNMLLIGKEKSADGQVMFTGECAEFATDLERSFKPVFVRKSASRGTKKVAKDTFAINAAAFRQMIAAHQQNS
jgi:hypothetical protein